MLIPVLSELQVPARWLEVLQQARQVYSPFLRQPCRCASCGARRWPSGPSSADRAHQVLDESIISIHNVHSRRSQAPTYSRSLRGGRHLRTPGMMARCQERYSSLKRGVRERTVRSCPSEAGSEAKNSILKVKKVLNAESTADNRRQDLVTKRGLADRR